MLTIRPAQFVIFSQLEVQKFEEWMLGHLRKCFPRQCAGVGDGPLGETIRYGIQRAQRYGITAKNDVCKYIDLMVVFGRYFDTDDRLKWAGEILRKARPPGYKMHTLLRAATKHLGP